MRKDGSLTSNIQEMDLVTDQEYHHVSACRTLSSGT